MTVTLLGAVAPCCCFRLRLVQCLSSPSSVLSSKNQGFHPNGLSSKLGLRVFSPWRGLTHVCHSILNNCKQLDESKTTSPSIATSQEEGLLSRRLAILCSSLSIVSISSSPLKAEEKKGKEAEDNNGIIGAITSLFDPNEKTKTGKVLPKAYVKSAREVVKTLKESLEEDAKDVAKFRRAADAAKEAIREYLNGWQGQKVVVTEESYAALEKAIRSLASFYSKAGPFAPISDEVKTNILEYLNTADATI